VERSDGAHDAGLLEDYTFLTSMAIADIGGPSGAPDGYPEVIEGDGAYFVHAVDACGRETPGWPKFTNGWDTGTPAVGDIDGDKSLEVVTTTREGWLFAWHTSGTTSGVVQWESFHHDNANTGNYATKLDQGVLEAAATPIDCSVPPPTTGPSYEPGGCATTSTGPSSSGLLAIGGAFLAGALARRRKRRGG